MEEKDDTLYGTITLVPLAMPSTCNHFSSLLWFNCYTFWQESTYTLRIIKLMKMLKQKQKEITKIDRKLFWNQLTKIKYFHKIPYHLLCNTFQTICDLNKCYLFEFHLFSSMKKTHTHTNCQHISTSIFNFCQLNRNTLFIFTFVIETIMHTQSHS